MALGVMILVKKASWSMSRFVGIILFFIASTSIVGWYHDYMSTRLDVGSHDSVGVFDLFGLLKTLMGSATAFIAVIILWFSALYLTLRISYRVILSKVRESVPSLTRMRDVIIPTDDEDEDIVPTKKAKTDEVYKKKAEELERKIAALQKNKEAPKKEEKSFATGKALLANAFSSLNKKIPLETPEGKVIE